MNNVSGLLRTTVMVETGPAAGGENTKIRQLQYDAFGNLFGVCEVTSTLTGHGLCAPTALSSGFWTTYNHDVLNNLTSVSQDSQPGTSATQARSYSFDGVNRVTSETNPEMGGSAIIYKYDTDSVCGTSNGDLVKRTDPVGNVTCYAYDALHRLLGTIYSGPYSASTPARARAVRTAFAVQTALTVASAANSVAYKSAPGMVAGILGGQMSLTTAVTTKELWGLSEDLGKALPFVGAVVNAGATLYDGYLTYQAYAACRAGGHE